MDQQQGWVVAIVAIAAIWLAARIVGYQLRKTSLIKKYGREIGLKILGRKVWQGMTEEQLTDSWGKPVETDRSIYKTKTKETWKYNKTGKNRFKDPIYFEDGIVVGWKN
jgi:hypothetical protein